MPNNTGQLVSFIYLEGCRHAVRVYTFITGIILEHAPKNNVDLYYKAGKYCGRLTKKMVEYPAAQSFKGQDFEWSLENATKSRKYLHLLTDESTKSIIKTLFDRFDCEVIQNKASFEHGLIHSDLNCNNIIVGQSNGDYDVVGVIDFGEADWSILMFDLAILIAHIIEHAEGDINAGSCVIKGYLSERQLSKTELSALWLAVKTRIAQCLVLCNQTASRDPSNTYICEAVASNQHLLRLLHSRNDQEILNTWNITN